MSIHSCTFISLHTPLAHQCLHIYITTHSASSSRGIHLTPFFAFFSTLVVLDSHPTAASQHVLLSRASPAKSNSSRASMRTDLRLTIISIYFYHLELTIGISQRKRDSDSIDRIEVKDSNPTTKLLLGSYQNHKKLNPTWLDTRNTILYFR